jgi:ATP-dependent RNA helicase DeaD
MNSFNEMELHPQILKGVDAAGFNKPFPIQERAIGPLLAGLNVIGQARTGTGKTAAFGLPMLQAIQTSRNEVQALVLAPTRELALQITEELRRLGKYTGARLLTVYGGQSINVQFDALRHGVHAIIGTPGRIMDHIKRGSLDLSHVKFVVLDEADTMLDMGFIEDVEFILDSVPEPRQMSLFSATMPPRIIDLSRKYIPNPERIMIDSDEPSVDELDQYYTVLEQHEKLDTLLGLLGKEDPTSSIVFCRTRYGVRKLTQELRRRYLNAVELHGDLSQAQREHSMGLFRSERADILVATDVASRGIDISHVEFVINYDVPQDPLLYFHRVGRTARAGNTGKSYAFVSYDEFQDFARIVHMTKAKIKPMRDEDAKHNFHEMQVESTSSSGYRRYGSRRSYRGSSSGNQSGSSYGDRHSYGERQSYGGQQQHQSSRGRQWRR